MSFLFSRKVYLTGSLYFAEQFSIIASAHLNGAVLTSLFVLFGDAILSPLLSLIFRVNSVRLRYWLFSISLLITVPSSAMLVLYGNSLTIPGILGFLLLIAVMMFVPIAFIVLNVFISEGDAAKTLAGTFFWPGLITLLVGFSGLVPTISIFQNPTGLVSLVFTGVTSMGVAYYLFFASSKRNGFAIASVLQALIPVFTLVTIHFTEGTQVSFVLVILLVLACFGSSLSIYSVKET